MHKTAAEMRLESSHRFTDAIYKMMAFFWRCLKKDCRKAITFLTASNALYRARSTKDGSDFEKADRKLMRFFWVYS